MDDCAWMYSGWKQGGLDLRMDSEDRGSCTWCPCTKCGYTRRQTREDMTQHLCNYGFTRDYTRWTYHGEANRMRNEVDRQRIEDHDADAGVGDMLDDFREAHFKGERSEEEPNVTPQVSVHLNTITAPHF